ncbi:MAG: rhodanese-like domain-containing protein [Gammaproteobacteria bacterium]
MSATPIAQCDVATLATRLAGDETSRDFVLLDVREDWEREIAAIEGSFNVLMNDIPDRLDDIRAEQQDKDLIVFCHKGSRSMVIAQFLQRSGFERVINLTGGIDAWSQLTADSRHLY